MIDDDCYTWCDRCGDNDDVNTSTWLCAACQHTHVRATRETLLPARSPLTLEQIIELDVVKVVLDEMVDAEIVKAGA